MSPKAQFHLSPDNVSPDCSGGTLTFHSVSGTVQYEFFLGGLDGGFGVCDLFLVSINSGTTVQGAANKGGGCGPTKQLGSGRTLPQ